MAEFLSAEWFDAMTAAARDATSVPTHLDLTVQQVVHDGDGATCCWYVAVRGGAVSVGQGRHPSPSITFTLDRVTAAGIQSGQLSAQGAFMAGRLRIGGDVRTLLDQQGALEELDDVFGAVRAATTYDDATATTGDGDG